MTTDLPTTDMASTQDSVVQPEHSILIFNDATGAPSVSVSGRYVDNLEEILITLEYSANKIRLTDVRNRLRTGEF